MVAISNFEAVLAGGEQDDVPDNAFIFSFRLPQRMWQSRDVGYFKVGHANMGLVLTPRYTKNGKSFRYIMYTNQALIALQLSLGMHLSFVSK